MNIRLIPLNFVDFTNTRNSRCIIVNNLYIRGIIQYIRGIKINIIIDLYQFMPKIQ